MDSSRSPIPRPVSRSIDRALTTPPAGEQVGDAATVDDAASLQPLRAAIDHLAGPLADAPEAALAELGLHEVRSYRITVAGEVRYNVVAVDAEGCLRSATAWSPAGAVALLIADLAAAPLAA
jgi:hypothetical protein